MTIKNFFTSFKPFQKGIEKVLGHLETEIMEIVWKQGKVSVRDVFQELNLSREVAYTTVMTIMGRLANKNILQKEQKGNAYLYSPVISREEFTNTMVSDVLDGLMEDYEDVAFAHFMKKLSKQDEKKIAEVEELIRLHKEKGE